MKTKITMNGKELTNLTELRENFDIEAAIALQKENKLSDWLEELYYETEAEAVRPFKHSSWNNSERKRFCSILGVDYAACLPDELKSVFESNCGKLAELTDDINILNNADAVAADQSQLAELINNGEKTIVLYKGEFSIPMSKPGITYYCVGSPKISGLCTADQYKKLGITVNGIDLPTEENKGTAESFRAAACSNGYDFFYEEHSALANYFHKALTISEPSFYCNVGIASSSPTFRSRSECEKAKNAEIKRFYNKASSYLSPSAEHGFVSEAEERYTKLITDAFDKIKDGLRASCEQTGKTALFDKIRDLCENASRNLRKQLTEEITGSDYYKMYDLKYFLDRVDVEKDDYSEGFDPASRFLMHFAEGWIEYHYESLCGVLMELQDDIDNFGRSFAKDAHGVYTEYVQEIEKLADGIGKGITLPDGTGIVEYLAKIAPMQSSQSNDSYPAVESLYKPRETSIPKSPSTAKIIQI